MGSPPWGAITGSRLGQGRCEERGFQSCGHEGVDLEDANVGGADLRAADLRTRRDPGFRNTEETRFWVTDKKGAKLAGANLSGWVFFRSLNYEGLDLRGANLEDAILRGNFRNADLRGANFYNARFTKELDLYGADLRGADLRQVENRHHAKNFRRANLADAILRGTRDTSESSGPELAGRGNWCRWGYSDYGGRWRVLTRQLRPGAAFAERVLSGQQTAASVSSAAAVGGSVGNPLGAGSGGCEIPGYPSPPGGMEDLGLPWCSGSVDFQVRSFALMAAGAQCAIATGSSSTAAQIQARRQEIVATCEQLAEIGPRLGAPNCRCPESIALRERSSGNDDAREELRARLEAQREARRREEEERQRQQAENAQRRLEQENQAVLESDCSCISIDADGEYSCMDGFVVGNNSIGEPLCDISR